MRNSIFAAVAAAAMMLAPACALAGHHDDDSDQPVVEHTTTMNALEALPRLPVSQRKVVTIYEFRSGAPGVDPTGLTDRFTNAVMQSGAFLVTERQRLMPDIATEKTLNAEGKTTGDTSNQKIAAAQYIFEGVVSASNANQDSQQTSFSLGGATYGNSGQVGKIAITVRVIDADSGLVLDSVVVSKLVRSRAHGISGIGNLANSIAGLGGHSIPLAPDVSTSSSHNEGVDEAVDACIDAAVLELVRRYGAGGG